MSETQKRDPITLVKWGTLFVSLVWIGMFGWTEIYQRYERTGYYGPGVMFDQRYQQRIRDCRGTFQERYDCKSGHVRDKYVRLFYFWSQKVTIVFGPAIGFGLIWLWFYFFVERKREGERRRKRLIRIDEKAMTDRQQAIEAGRRQIAEVERRKAGLPAEESDREREFDAAQEDEAVSIGLQILLIEEDEDKVLEISRALKKTDSRVIASFKMTDGLKRFTSGEFDLVVASISMSDTSGLEAIGKLRTVQPDVKILALVDGFSDASPEAAEQAAGAIGVDAILPATVDMDTLTESIVRLAG